MRYYDDELYHYGRKGMKWGQHIYGRNSVKVKKAKNWEAVNEIYKTLTPSEKYKVSGSRNQPVLHEFDYDPKRAQAFVAYNKNVPVSAFVVKKLNNSQADVEILTRNDPNFRGKGYASKVASKGLKWVEKKSNFSEVYWDVAKTNTGSRKIAEKNSFKNLGSGSNKQWVSYQKKYKRKQKVKPYE